MVASLQSVIPVSSKMRWASEECSKRMRKRSPCCARSRDCVIVSPPLWRESDPGVRLGLALGKRPRLALAGTEGRVELTAEPLVLALLVVDPSLKGFAVATPDRFHTGIVRSSRTCSCAGGRRGMVRFELGPQIKYHHRCPRLVPELFVRALEVELECLAHPAHAYPDLTVLLDGLQGVAVPDRPHVRTGATRIA